MGSHPLSEPWLSHLENGNGNLAEPCKAEREKSFSGAVSVEKLSQIKGQSSLLSAVKDSDVGSAGGAGMVITDPFREPRQAPCVHRADVLSVPLSTPLPPAQDEEPRAEKS